RTRTVDPLLTMEVPGRYWRTQPGIRDHVFPANRQFEMCPQCPRVSARAQADVPVSYPQRVVCSQNAQRRRASVAVHRRSANLALVAIAWRSRVGVEKSRLVREHDCLDAVTEVEFLEDVRDVCLDGRVADVELLSDLDVREAAGDQAKNVELAPGQIVELL